jgi:hypothetical protein
MTTIPNRPVIPATGEAAEQHPDLTRLRELAGAVDATSAALSAAQAAYESALRDSGYDEPGDDPHVIATREARDAVRMAHSAAQDRLDEVLSDGPTLLTRETTALLSRRSLGRWADTRAADELTTAVRQIVAALSMGRAVRIEVI